MKLVDLENPRSLPDHLKQELQACDRYFFRHQFLEQVRHEPLVRVAIERINSYCTQNMVVGYHYTRAIPKDLRESGLQARSGAEIRSLFLERFGYRFTESQLEKVKTTWGRCYDERMRKARDNRIYFNFTRTALGNSGARLLQKNYGGEQVYFYIDKLPGVGEILSSIGEPLVVKCALIPAEVKTYLAQPWGEIAVSSYHRIVNPSAHQVDQDGHQFAPVPPERIGLLSAEH